MIPGHTGVQDMAQGLKPQRPVRSLLVATISLSLWLASQPPRPYASEKNAPPLQGESTPSPTATLSPPSETPSPSTTSSATVTEPPTATETPTASATPQPGPSASPTTAPTPTATPLPTPAPTSLPTPYPVGAVLINEVAWSGTRASPNDEWIELYNPGPDPVDLNGWRLSDGGDVNVALMGTIPAYGFYLLERSDDRTVSDIPADRIYTGALKNSGEALRLTNPSGVLVDSANRRGRRWPAGEVASRASMERRGGTDTPGNWGTFTGYFGNGRDADGRRIQGTPRAVNSLFFPTPTPTWIPGEIVINEVLIRPHYDWNGKGGATLGDEFIELYNRGPKAVYLNGWILDDIADGGSSPFTLPPITIPAGGYRVFFRQRTKIALNDGGDTVRLMAPNGRLVDEITYLKVRAYNLSYGRLPDGSDHFFYGLWPTPRDPNLLFVEPTPAPASLASYPIACPGGGKPTPRLPRLARNPPLLAHMQAMGLIVCR